MPWVTKDEIDALPEIGGYLSALRVTGGRRVRVEVPRTTYGLSHMSLVRDRSGVYWYVGWIGDKQYKRKRLESPPS